jgi:hypothetical protein
VKAIYWRTAGFLACILIVLAVVLDVEDRSNKNRVAIEKGCVLLNNAIVQSGAAGGGPSKVLVAEILRNAVQHHRAYVVINYKDALKKTKRLTLVNCDEVAKHPDRIHAEPLAPPPKRSVPKHAQ